MTVLHKLPSFQTVLKNSNPEKITNICQIEQHRIMHAMRLYNNTWRLFGSLVTHIMLYTNHVTKRAVFFLSPLMSVNIDSVCRDKQGRMGSCPKSERNVQRKPMCMRQWQSIKMMSFLDCRFSFRWDNQKVKQRPSLAWGHQWTVNIWRDTNYMLF